MKQEPVPVVPVVRGGSEERLNIVLENIKNNCYE